MSPAELGDAAGAPANQPGEQDLPAVGTGLEDFPELVQFEFHLARHSSHAAWRVGSAFDLILTRAVDCNWREATAGEL